MSSTEEEREGPKKVFFYRNPIFSVAKDEFEPFLKGASSFSVAFIGAEVITRRGVSSNGTLSSSGPTSGETSSE